MEIQYIFEIKSDEFVTLFDDKKGLTGTCIYFNL